MCVVHNIQKLQKCLANRYINKRERDRKLMNVNGCLCVCHIPFEISVYMREHIRWRNKAKTKRLWKKYKSVGTHTSHNVTSDHSHQLSSAHSVDFVRRVLQSILFATEFFTFSITILFCVCCLNANTRKLSYARTNVQHKQTSLIDLIVGSPWTVKRFYGRILWWILRKMYPS